jgi:hypothetical protein
MSRARNTSFVLIALISVYAACTHADDGFRARLAAGCNSEAVCVALYESADARWQRCMHDDNTGRSCSEQAQDRSDAQAMFKKVDDETEQARRDAIEAPMRKAQEEFQKRQAEEEAARAKEECSQPFLATATRHIDQHLALDERTDLGLLGTQANSEAADARDAILQIRHCDPELADRLAPDVEAWLAQINQAIKDEDACRKTPSCMTPRFVEPLCQAISDRRSAGQSMARERSNPSGYVDRRVLYDLGQRIQGDDDTIQDLKAKYVALMHKAFNDAACPKTSE